MPDYEKIAEQVSVPENKDSEGVIPPENVAGAQSVANREFLPENHQKYQGIASQRGYGQERQRLGRVHYSHDALIDEMIADPTVTQRALAKQFGYSENWISTVVGSDAFQAALAKRRDDLTNPFLMATIEERFNGLARQSLDVIAEKLETTRNTDLALKALDISVKALGFGARTGGQTNNTQFVIQLPPKSDSADAWQSTHAPIKQLPQDNA